MTEATSAILNKAADLIEERGWVGTNGEGWEVDGAPLCIEGAISAAMGAPLSQVKPPNAKWNDALRYNFGTGDFIPARTAEQVIATLRAAALIEATKENAETHAPVTA